MIDKHKVKRIPFLVLHTNRTNGVGAIDTKLMAVNGGGVMLTRTQVIQNKCHMIEQINKSYRTEMKNLHHLHIVISLESGWKKHCS